MISPPSSPSGSSPGQFVPPKPEPLPPDISAWRRIREALRSSIGFLQAGGYATGVGRHKIPRLPGTRQRFSYTVRDPAVMREMLVRRPFDFPKSRVMYDMLAPLVGLSVFTSNGDTWRKQRALIDRAFEQARLQDVFPMMRDAGDALCARLDRAASADHPAQIDAEATMVAADIIFRTIFSEPIDEPTAADLFQTFEAFQGLAYAHGMMSMARLPMWLLPGRRRAIGKARRMRRVLGGLLDKRLAAIAAGEPVPQDDILASLVRPDADGATPGRDALLNEICVLFLAGHETSAAGLAWTLYLMSECPATQERARAEVLAALGERPIAFADLRHLPFTRDVFRESLRLYPPLAFVTRDTIQPETLATREAEPDSVVFVQTWSLHRNPEIWPEPDAFDPARWQCPYAKAAQRQGYLPFGMGPRVCAGAGFAMQEAVLLLAMLLRGYRFEPVPGADAPQPAARLTLRSANGIKLKVTRTGGQNA